MVHEFGHFIAAKRAGLKIEEFGIGYPPRIFGKKIGETLYSINLIPFGGFVKIYGESPNKELLKDKRSFCAQPPKTKAKIVLAGIIANIILAVFLLYAFLFAHNFSSYQTLLFDYRFPFGRQEILPVVLMVAPESPAEQAGISAYDIILSLNGKKVKKVDEFISYVKEHAGEKITIQIENLVTNKVREIEVIPRKEYPETEGPLGIGIKRVIYPSSLLSALKLAGYFTGKITLDVIRGLFLLISSLVKEKSLPPGVEPMSVVGMFYFFYETAKINLLYFLELIGVVAIYLAVFNILPIPALDGGKLLFLGIEAIRRKPLSPKLEQKITAFFFLVLIFLVIFVTLRFDIPRLLK